MYEVESRQMRKEGAEMSKPQGRIRKQMDQYDLVRHEGTMGNRKYALPKGSSHGVEESGRELPKLGGQHL